jgi:hypothetical protein
MATEYLNNKLFESDISDYQKHRREKIRYEFILEDINKTIKNKSNKTFSLKEEELLQSNVGFYETATKNYKDYQNKLALKFHILSENVVKYFKFNLIDIDDAIQEGVVICFEKVVLFDPRKGRAFNYLTTCIVNHLRQLYRYEKSQNELKKKFHDYIYSQVGTTVTHMGKEMPCYKNKSSSQII